MSFKFPLGQHFSINGWFTCPNEQRVEWKLLSTLTHYLDTCTHRTPITSEVRWDTGISVGHVGSTGRLMTDMWANTWPRNTNMVNSRRSANSPGSPEYYYCPAKPSPCTGGMEVPRRNDCQCHCQCQNLFTLAHSHHTLFRSLFNVLDAI